MSTRTIDWDYKKVNDELYIAYIKDFDMSKVNVMVKFYNDEKGYEALKICKDDEFSFIPSTTYTGDKTIFDIRLAIIDDFNDKNLIEIFSEYPFKNFVDIMNYINNENIKINEDIKKVNNNENDVVNKPNHYQLNIKGNNIEVIDIIDEVVKDYKPQEAFKIANVIKYILRASKKNGKEDLKKARKYIDILLEDKNV